MNLSWRLYGGLLFSLTFHILLISTMFYAYPGIKNKGEWILNEFPLLPSEKKPTSFSSFDNKEIDSEIISRDKMIYPDLIKTRNHKKNHQPQRQKK